MPPKFFLHVQAKLKIKDFELGIVTGLVSSVVIQLLMKVLSYVWE